MSTNVTVSVIFYFTEEFEAITPDIKGHVEGLIDNTNIAFLRSGIPVRLAMHCMLKSEIREAPDSTERIREFKESQGKKTLLIADQEERQHPQTGWKDCADWLRLHPCNRPF